MNTRKPTRILTSSIAALAATLAPSIANAATLYWDRGAATNAWGTAANWSTVAGAATPDPAAAPVAADLAVFNISTLNTAQTVDMGADRAALGLQFVTTGTLALQGGGANRTLTLGASGLDKTATGTGAITIGSGTANQNVNVRLSANQTWQNNNNTGAIVVNNTLTASSAVARTLTLSGSSTAGNQINAVISNNGAGVFSIVKTGAGLWILNAANTFTGGVTLSAGTLRTATTAGLGTGTVTFGSGSTGRLQINNGLTIANNIVVDSGVTGVAGQGLIDVNGTGRRTIAGTVTLNGSPTAGGTFRTSNTLGDELVLAGAVNGSTLSASQRDGRVMFSGGGSLAGNYTVTGTLLAGATNGIPQALSVILGGSANGALDLNGFSQALAGLTLGNALNSNTGFATLRSGVLTLNGDVTAVASVGTATNVINGYGGGSIDFGATARNLAVGDNLSAVDLSIVDTAITSGGGLTKTGTGNLALNNTAIAGALTASAGALSVGNLGASTTSLGLNGVTINSAGLLSGGTVTATGSNTINYIPAGASPLASTFHSLISYTGTTPGISNFTLGTIGPRMTATLVDTGSAIALDVTANDSVTWKGTVDSAWNINTTQNWETTVGVAAANYLEGDHVKFDDSGLNTNIALGVAVNPARLEFIHTTPNTYSISGAGSISGGGDIVHSGTGSTRIATLNNSIAGPVAVTAGTLELDHGAVANQTVLTTARVNVSAGGTLALTSDNVDFNFARPVAGAGTVVIDPNSGGTAGPRAVAITGRNDLFSGTLSLSPTAAGGTFRLTANDLGVLGTATLDVNDGAQFWPQNNQNYSNNLILTGTGYNEVAGGAPASIAASTTSGVYIGTGTPLFSYAGIGAIRGEGQTLTGNIDLQGSAKVSAHNGTLTLGGIISGDSSETLVIGGGSDANTVFFTGNNTYEGRTWVNGGSTNAAARTVTLQIGNNTTTGSLGTGEVVLYANTLHTALLRFQRSDGYTLAPGQNIIAAAAASADLAGRATVQVNTQGTGLTLNGNTIDLTDGVNGGDFQVGVNITGASVNLNGASVLDVRNFLIGEQANNSAIVNHAGTSAVTAIGHMRIGHWPTETSAYNISGGTLDITGLPGIFPYTIGGTETNGGIYVGIDGQGALNQTGGTVSTNFVVLDNRGNSAAGANMVTGVDTYQLDAGTLQLKSASGIVSRNATTAVNLNGGTIQAAVGINPALDSNTITVQAGGVTLDGNVGSTFPLYGPLAGTGTVTLAGNAVLSTLDGTGATLTAAGGGMLGGSLGTASAIVPAGSTLASNRASGVEVWSGAVSGAGAITKAGAGTLQMVGNYSGLTGGITVNGGRAELIGTFAATQAVTVNDGGTISGEPTLDLLTIGSVAGATISFDANSAGAITVNTLTVPTGTTNSLDFNTVPTGGGPWNVINYTTLVGTGGFALGPTYRGGTITDTSFNIQVDNVVRSALTWTGGTSGVWDINTTANNWNNTTPAADNFFNADDVAFGDGPTNVAIALTGSLKPWAVNVNAATTNYTFTSTAGNQLAGPVGITKSGASNLTLAGPNVHFGATNISGGTVTISDPASLGSGAATNGVNLTNNAALTATVGLTLGANRTLNLGTGGGTVNLTNAAAQTLTINGPVTGSGNLNLRNTGAGAGTFAVSGSLAGFSGNLNVQNTSTGAGTYTLSGNNAGFTGAITAGATSTGLTTLTIANSAAVGNASSITLNFPAAGVTGNATTLNLPTGVTLPAATTLNFTSSLPTAAISLRTGMALAGTVNIDSPITLSGDSIVQFNGAAASVTNYGGAITEATPGAYVQSGLSAFSNTLFFRGTGTHNINNTITLPSAGSTISITDGAIAVLNVVGNDYRSANAAFGTIRLGVTDAIPTTARLVIGQTGDQVATFDLNGFDQTVAGLEWLAVNGNLLTKGISNTHATATSTFTLNQAIAPGVANFNGTISGRTNFVKEGAATTSLIAPASNFTGNVTVNAGTLSATGGGAANGANGTLGAANVVGKTVTVNNAGSTLSFLTNNIFGNGIANSDLPAVTINSGVLTSTRYNVLGALALNGGTLTQSATDTGGYEGFQFRGNVTVGGSAASTISTGNAKANHLGANTTFTVADATAGVDLLVSAPLRDQSADFASAAGGLTKDGPGTMELSGVSSYTGATVVSAGTLNISGTLSGSAVTVSGGTLIGSGSIVQGVTINTGATLAPGTSPGQLDTGNLNLASGSSLAIEIGGTVPATEYDQLNVTGTITLGGDVAFSLINSFSASGSDRFWIGLNDGAEAVSGVFGNVAVTDIPNNAGMVNMGGIDYTVYYGADFATDALTGGNDILVTIPEPGSAIMLLSGMGMLIGLQRRRRK